MGCSRYMKKASRTGAFFIALFSTLLAQACPAPGVTRTVTVARVVDGDTLRLTDGRSLRLIGINAPELDPRRRSGPEPFAQAARKHLQQLVAASGGRVSIFPVRPEKDRYGRSLVHLFDARGSNLEAQLLAAGLGYFVAFAPASPIASCQQASERAARHASAGLWADVVVRAVDDLRDPGFAVLRGELTSVDDNAGGTWLAVDGGLVLRVAPSERASFASLLAGAVPGRRLEARGWVVERRSGAGKERARWLLTLSDPLMLEWLD